MGKANTKPRGPPGDLTHKMITGKPALTERVDQNQPRASYQFKTTSSVMQEEIFVSFKLIKSKQRLCSDMNII